MARPDLIAGDVSAARGQTPLAFQEAFAARWATAAAERAIRTLEDCRRDAACPVTDGFEQHRAGRGDNRGTSLLPQRPNAAGRPATPLLERVHRIPRREPLRGDHAPAGAPQPGRGRTEYENSCASERGLAGSAA
ncbi:DUF6207 family protein [Streptomyces sp. NPDC002078]